MRPDEFDFRVVSAGDGAVAALKAASGLVVLDTTVTPELELEGRARDLIRQIQQARRDADLDVSDRIRLTINGAPDVVAAFEAHRQLVTGETLATAADAIVDSGAAAGQATVSVARAETGTYRPESAPEPVESGVHIRQEVRPRWLRVAQRRRPKRAR